MPKGKSFLYTIKAMEKKNKLNLIGQALLLVATLAWGSSFLILKNTIEHVPGFFVIFIRFLAAAIIVGLIFIKRIIKINKRSFICGLILGVTVGFAYLIQTWGLKYTTPSHNAFLTATYCIMCPFLYWLLYKRKPKIYNIIAALLCMVGIALISFLGGKQESGSNILLGDAITLLSAVFYALQIIFIDKFQEEGIDTIVLIVLQFFFVSIVLLIGWLVFELPTSGLQAIANINGQQWLSILYLTVACTLVAQIAQMVGQRWTTANQSAVILSLEAVFGAMFSVIFGTETLTVFLVIGFVLTFSSILINEFKLDPIKLFKKRYKDNSVKVEENEQTQEK